MLENSEIILCQLKQIECMLSAIQSVFLLNHSLDIDY